MANYDLEEGQIVLCTVDKIIGTTVFVKIEDNGEGTITTSEISPGRTRNLRDYVIPGKKIVCKILKISNEKIYLSLRRVKQYEKKELLDKISKERSYKSILKTVLGEERSKEVISEITKEYTMVDFFDKIKEDTKIIESFLSKSEAEKVIKILESKKEKPKEVKQLFKLSDKSPSGINSVKSIISKSCKDTKCNVFYIAAGKYRLSITGPDFKEIKSEVSSVLENIEKEAKKNGCEFEIVKG